MCFGVRDAIALALEHADAGPLTILGDLVHNPTVLSALEAKGIAVAQDAADVQTPTVMVTAHGTSERKLARTRALGLTVVEATCPLVRVAHRAVVALARDGYHVVIIGQRNHVEVRGLTGDLDRFDVVLEDADVLALEAHPRIGIAAQTTQSVEKVRHMVDADPAAIPAIGSALRRHRLQADQGAPDRRHRDGAAGRRRHRRRRPLAATTPASWSRPARVTAPACITCRPTPTSGPNGSMAREVVGLTAGTSTPDEVIDRVEARIRQIADGSHGSDAVAWSIR